MEIAAEKEEEIVSGVTDRLVHGGKDYQPKPKSHIEREDVTSKVAFQIEKKEE